MFASESSSRWTRSANTRRDNETRRSHNLAAYRPKSRLRVNRGKGRNVAKSTTKPLTFARPVTFQSRAEIERKRACTRIRRGNRCDFSLYVKIKLESTVVDARRKRLYGLRDSDIERRNSNEGCTEHLVLLCRRRPIPRAKETSLADVGVKNKFNRNC